MRLTVLISALFGLSACQSIAEDTPATIIEVDPLALATTLVGATGRAGISMTPPSPIGASQISVLPHRLTEYETRSPVTPIQFEVRHNGETCYLKRADTGTIHHVSGLTCRTAQE